MEVVGENGPQNKSKFTFEAVWPKLGEFQSGKQNSKLPVTCMFDLKSGVK